MYSLYILTVLLCLEKNAQSGKMDWAFLFRIPAWLTKVIVSNIAQNYICLMKLEEALQTNRFTGEIHKATVNLLYTAYWLRNNLSGALKKEGLSPEQFNVMRILRGKHPEMMWVKDIASRMVEKSSNVPRIIDKLTEKNLAKTEVSKIDRRATVVSLTENGLSVLARASSLVNNVNASITGMSEPEARALNELLEKMRTP